MSEFIKIAKITDVPDPGKKLIEVEDRFVVLIHAGGSFYCIDDVCTHDGGTLGDGQLDDDGTLACPRHGAKFDIRTGKALTMPATQPTAVYETRVEGEDVFVKLSAD
jgi:3-phenylpropionate/trans-cinnamate dioxygenase ferredoxin subunit